MNDVKYCPTCDEFVDPTTGICPRCGLVIRCDTCGEILKPNSKLPSGNVAEIIRENRRVMVHADPCLRKDDQIA